MNALSRFTFTNTRFLPALYFELENELRFELNYELRFDFELEYELRFELDTSYASTWEPCVIHFLYKWPAHICLFPSCLSCCVC